MKRQETVFEKLFVLSLSRSDLEEHSSSDIFLYFVSSEMMSMISPLHKLVPGL